MTAVNWAHVAQGGFPSAVDTHPSFDVDNLNDGNYGTRWASLSTPVALLWIKSTLTQARAITSVKLSQYADGNYAATVIRIEYANDDSSWYSLGTFNVTSWDQEFTFPETTARYWKVTATEGGTYNWNCWEMEVWGDDGGGYPGGECDYDEILRDVWDQTGGADKSSVLVAYGIPYLIGTGSIYNYLAAILCRLNTLHDKVDLLEIAVGDHDPSNQLLMDKLNDIDGDLQSGITVIATNDNANTAAIEANDNQNTSALVALVNARTIDVTDAITATQEALAGVDARDLTHVHDDIASGISALAINDNANTALVRGDPATDLRSILDTMISSFAQQTVDLRGPLGTTHDELASAIAGVQADTDDIQLTLAALPSNPTPLRLWPGLSGVTFGAPVVLSAPGQITAPCHGVTVTIDAYPPGQSRQPAGSTIRHKGIAWVAFVNDAGDFEQLEQVQHSESVIITKQLEIAAGLAVYCKPGCTLTVTPFTIDAL